MAYCSPALAGLPDACGSPEARSEANEASESPASSWVVVQSPSSASSASLVDGGEFMTPEVLEPVLDRVGTFLVQSGLDDQDVWPRMSLKWVGLLASTCTAMRAARTELFLSALERTGAAGDAHAISRVLQQPWGAATTVVHETGVRALLSLVELEDLEERALDEVEDQILRVACWERGVSTVIHSLKVCSAPAVQEPGLAFLLKAARLDPCRGLMALCGAFGVLVECASSSTCQDHIQEQCSHVLDVLVQGADEVVMELLTAYRSHSIPDIELSLAKIQQWLPKSNTAAEIAVGLAVEAMKAHPDQAKLHTECFKCLRDLNHDTKVAISHAGGVMLTLGAMQRFKKDSALQHSALSTLLLLAGSSSHRVGGAGGGGISEIVREIVSHQGINVIVASMRVHSSHAGVQQQACNLLLAMAELSRDCRADMVAAGVKRVVSAAIQHDVLSEMRISLQGARNLLRLLR